MASVSVCVDVDLDEVDTWELVEEICSRLRRGSGRKSLTDKEKKELKENMDNLQEALLMVPVSVIEVKTLDDKMKYEHLSKVFTKYSYVQLESMLPE